MVAADYRPFSVVLRRWSIPMLSSIVYGLSSFVVGPWSSAVELVLGIHLAHLPQGRV